MLHAKCMHVYYKYQLSFAARRVVYLLCAQMILPFSSAGMGELHLGCTDLKLMSHGVADKQVVHARALTCEGTNTHPHSVRAPARTHTRLYTRCRRVAAGRR